MSTFIANKYAQIRISGWRVAENARLEFDFAPRLSSGQDKTVKKLFQRGFGMGGTPDPQMVYEMYLLANKPNYILSLGMSESFDLRFMKTVSSELIKELDSQLFTYHKLVSEPVPAGHWLANVTEYLHGRESAGGGITPAVAGYYTRFHYDRMIGSKLTYPAYYKALGNKAVSILGYDQANAEALKMYVNRTELCCVMEYPGYIQVTPK